MRERPRWADAVLAQRARAQWPLLSAVLATLIACSSLVGVTALLRTDGQHRALAAAVFNAAGGEGVGSPDLVTASVKVLAPDPGAPEGTKALVADATSAMVDAVRPYAATTSVWAASPMMYLSGDPVRQGYLLDADSALAHGQVVSGRWPAATSVGSPLEVAIPTTTATALGLAVGSSVRLSDSAPHADNPRPDGVDLVVVGIFVPDATTAWTRDVLGGAGYAGAATQLPVYGPFLVAPGAVVGADRPVGQLSVVVDSPLSGDPGALPNVVRSIGGLRGRLSSVIGSRLDSVDVRSDLGAMLAQDRAEQNRTAAIVLVVVLLILALGVAALGLVGRLVVQRRETETAMLIDRGASRAQLAAAAGLEALALAALATGVAAPLALAVYRGLVSAAPLGSAWRAAGGLGAPALGWPVVIAVAVGAVVPATALVAIGLRGAPARRGRRRGRVFARSGADLLVVAVAVLGYVQLRAHRIGTGAIDPILVVAPVLCIVAGALLVLRLLPIISRVAEARARRGRGFIFPLAGWQVARGRATSGAFLLVLAAAATAFGLVFLGTWHVSQGDQADAAVGADLVVGQAGASDTGARLAEATGGVVVPVTDRKVTLGSRPGGAQLLGLDTTKAAQVMRGRLPDGESWTSVTAGLAPQEPTAALTITGGGTGAVRLTIDGRVGGASLDTELTSPAHLLVTPTVIVSDDAGNLVTVEGTPVTIDGTPHDVSLPIANQDPVLNEHWRVIAIDLTLGMVIDGGLRDGSDGFMTADVSVHVAGAEASPGQWFSKVIGVPPRIQVQSTTRDGTTVSATLSATIFALAFSDEHLMLLGFPPVDEFPVVVSDALASNLGLAAGDQLSITSGEATVTGRILRSVPYVPGAPGGLAILADYDALGRALLTQGSDGPITDAWWVGNPSEGASARVVDAGLVPVETRAAATTALRDGPLRVALRVALGVLVGAALVLAIAGTAAHAASIAQTRATEVARLRGIGVSRRALFVTGLLQHGAVTTAAVVTGGLLGAFLAWLIGPLLIVGVGGLPSVPAAMVEWRWTLLVGVLAGLVLGGVAVDIPALRALVRRDAALGIRMGDGS